MYQSVFKKRLKRQIGFKALHYAGKGIPGLEVKEIFYIITCEEPATESLNRGAGSSKLENVHNLVLFKWSFCSKTWRCFHIGELYSHGHFTSILNYSSHSVAVNLEGNDAVL